MSGIHPSAIVHPDAQLGADVSVGPYALIHEGVQIGDRCRIGAYSVLHSGLSMGADNHLSEHVVLGGLPQDVGFNADIPSGVEIGSGNRFREFFTLHRATREGQATRIGSECLFMFSSHVAHDCDIEDRVVVGAYTALAGHVQVGEQAFVSGTVLVHQHVRIGRLSMTAGMVPMSRDVLPFALLGRDPVAHYGLNRVGLKRAGIDGENYRELESAWRALRDGAKAEELPGSSEEVAHLRAWLAEPSRRGHCGFVAPKRRRQAV